MTDFEETTDAQEAREQAIRTRLRKAREVLPGTRCAQCGGTELTGVPTFSVGAGITYRPMAEDICCLRCGYIGLPAF